MKATLAFLMLATACFTGCESDVPPARDAGRKFERGIRGQGTLYEQDRTEDPYVREQAPKARGAGETE
jgi:hypothetical protein